MPKYYPYKVADHFLYFTALCIVEAMHVHASDNKLAETRSAKFFVRADGSSVLKRRGDLTDRQTAVIRKFIRANYLDMYRTWKDFGGGDFYRN